MDIDLSIIKILIPWVVSFLFGLFISPIVISFLHKHKIWRNSSGEKKGIFMEEEDKKDNEKIFNIINKTEKDEKTPRMGGVVIFFSVCFTTLFFWIISYGIFGNVSGEVDFLSRSQTWIPLACFVLGAFLGFVDDFLTIKNIKIGKHIGFPLKYRIIFVVLISVFISFWFYFKLGYSQLAVPFYGNFELGFLFIPFFILAFLSVFATSNIDGLDGLSGGIMATVFSTMGFISFYQEQFNISAFCFVIVGAILSFLWFNISPAKFYMSEIGYNALSFCLVVIAFITDTIFILPIIAFMLFITLVTTVMQVFSIRFLGKKIFKIIPLHHHFEALGWSESQIVFRYWIISVIFAILGFALFVVAL